MCGITGWIDWEENLNEYKDIIENMAKTLQHRGPDDKGMWISKNAALGHTRLIVIDPEGGYQPMVREYGDNTYVLTYNGELYNTDELRGKLMNLGYNFRSHSDTEVLLTSYIEWGEKCVNYLNGIFAFGVWDEKNKKLFLARDHLGVKPLFYSRFDSSFVYGSEIKALLAHPKIKPEVGLEGLAEIFGLGPSRTPGHGIFKGINELQPAHYLIHDRNGTFERRYWSLKSEPHKDDLETTIEKVRELVLDAIKRQLVSDVPLCTFLSGGLDSSIISTVAAIAYKDRKLSTYSIDYKGNKENFIANEFQPNSDSRWIELMVKHIDSDHHNIMIDTIDLIRSLENAVIARDLPGMADIDSSLYLFSKEIKKNATVGLSGECADELFGGYPWFFREEDLNSNTFPWLRSLNEREKILSATLKTKLSLQDYVKNRYEETLAQVPRLIGETREETKMRELFYLNITWFMANLLERKDRMTMATGLEVRVPFADYRLVEYVWNIPWEIKKIEQREKGILRKAMKGILPDEIITRKKSPYPKTHNPEYSKLVKAELRNILNDTSSPLLELINVEYVRSMVESKAENFTIPWYGQLMTGPQLLAFLIQINIWLKRYNVVIK